MSFMKSMKGFGRTILGSNEAIQRGAHKIYNNSTGIRDVAEAVANNGEVKSRDIKRSFKSLMEDEGFAKQFEGKEGKDIDKAQAIAKHYQDNKEVYDNNISRQKATLEKMQGGTAAENFERLRDLSGHDDTIGGNLATLGQATDGYFRSGSKMTNTKRLGTVAAGHMGLSFVGRSLTGGSMGYNNQGERDIAGIPFV